MYQKVEWKLSFNKKRYRDLVTPCCNRTNFDGKFVSFKNLPNQYGYCHSCGKTIHPPSLYRNQIGEYYYWNNLSNKMEQFVLQTCHTNVLHNALRKENKCNTDCVEDKISQKYVDFELVKMYYNNKTVNNLLHYLSNTYGKEKTTIAKKMYHIGTSKNGGTVFWNINKQSKVQKAKVCYYKQNGKRTNYFKVPYKNNDGYYSCLFGEHLLKESKDRVILVESEKTAIVCSMILPNYTWLAYGGINGLTNNKALVLKGNDVIIIPDISGNATNIIKNKIPFLNQLNVNAKILDLSNDMDDSMLKSNGLYNCDLEDVFNCFQNKELTS